MSKILLPGVISKQCFAILKWYFMTDTYFLPLKQPYIPAMLWCWNEAKAWKCVFQATEDVLLPRRKANDVSVSDDMRPSNPTPISSLPHQCPLPSSKPLQQRRCHSTREDHALSFAPCCSSKVIFHKKLLFSNIWQQRHSSKPEFNHCSSHIQQQPKLDGRRIRISHQKLKIIGENKEKN